MHKPLTYREIRKILKNRVQHGLLLYRLHIVWQFHDFFCLNDAFLFGYNMFEALHGIRLGPQPNRHIVIRSSAGVSKLYITHF